MYVRSVFLASLGLVEATSVYTQIPGVTCGLQNGFPKISRKKRDTNDEDFDIREINGTKIVDLSPYEESAENEDKADLRIVGGTTG